MTTETITSPSRSLRFLISGWSTFSIGMVTTLCVVYLVFFGFRAVVEIDVQLQSPYPSFLKIYWADEGDEFVEKNMRQVRVKADKNNYQVFLTHLGNVDRLRIDPLEYAGEIKLNGLTITQNGYQPLSLSQPEDFAQLKPNDQAVLVNLSSATNGLSIQTIGRDSQLEWDVSPENTAVFPLVHIVNLLLIVLMVSALRRPCAVLLDEYKFVPGFLVVILLLATAMAATTGLDIHPDEQVHVKAVTYYGDHLLPPAIDSAIVEPTYSGYGVTRLGNYEIYYQLAGYFTWLLSPLHLSDLTEARLFGLLLLGLLLVYAIRNPEFRVFTIPLFISAQTWYLFSYANSDGFALFVAIIASYQAAYKDSLLNRFLSGEKLECYWSTLFLTGVLVGLLLLTKTNFYFFLLFLGVYFLWRMSCGDFSNQKLFWTRVVAICAVGLSIYGARVGLDYAANGPSPSVLRAEMAEQHAEKIYRPSTPMNEKHIYLYLKERGFSLDRIIYKEKWPGKTFLNAFGSYGFTQYFASSAFFETVKNTGIFLLVFMLVSILIRGTPATHGLFLLVLLSSSALVLMLLWRSWTISFQAQGRYLAPILPMLGILYYHIRPYLNEKVIMSLVMGLFLLGVYSFMFVGLHDIPKLDYFG